MTAVTRRKLLRKIAIYAMLAAVPLATTACKTIQPKPFLAGNVVGAPLGCEQLRADTPQADC